MENTAQNIPSSPVHTLLPDERALREHLAGGNFRLGVASGRWRLIAVKRPYVFLMVAAAAQPGAPTEYPFRFDFTNYPHDALAGCLWDIETGAILATNKWPGGTERVALGFNPGWRPDAIYLPCDRQARVNHEQWVTDHPEYLWSADKDITFYLEILYDYLHSRHYTGLRSA